MPTCDKPLLLVDVDGVISLFGFDPGSVPAGQYVNVDGIVHLLSATAGGHLRKLARAYELAWCTGWEEKAEEHLPLALEIPGGRPWVVFDPRATTTLGNWKLSAIDRFAAPTRPLAWIDDAHDASCRAWAGARAAPTLLLTTDPAVGLTGEHVAVLLGWASGLSSRFHISTQLSLK
jgi:hypothetical protein